jgi:dTDP-glucose 4,6-dehydratase
MITYIKPRTFKEKRYSTTTGGAVKTLGWKAQVSFDEGLKKTIQWYQDYWIK